MDGSRGEIDQDDSYEINLNGEYPFRIGNTQWTIEGYIEYIDGRDTAHALLGRGYAEPWLLSQLQLRMDIGELLFVEKSRLFAGVEYQYWNNKLGVRGVDERAVQLLAVWRF